MKRIAAFLGLAFVLHSCSDGDLVFETLNFSESRIENCGHLYFKSNTNEVLLVNLSGQNNDTLLHPDLPLNEVQFIATNDVNKIYYRTYSDRFNSNLLCSQIPPAQPIVLNEYTSLNGAIIEYTRGTTTQFVDKKATINYNYTINFRNLTLSNGVSEIKYEDYPFGTIISQSNELNFNFVNQAFLCENRAHFIESNREMILHTPSSITLPQSVGEVTYDLNANQYIDFILYKGSIIGQAECNAKSNEVIEHWQAFDGKLVITTTNIPGTSDLLHSYSLRQSTFKKESLSFYIDNITFKNN